MTVVNNLLSIFLYSDLSSPLQLVLDMLFVAGLWGLFRKSGVKPWHSLIPVLREYEFGVCAGRKPEGRVFAFLRALLIVSNSISYWIPLEDNSFGDLLALITLLILLIWFVFQLRIALGLIEVYGRRKLWVLLWATVEWFPAMLWGWLDRYQPLWKVEDIRSEAAEFFSGSKAAVLDQGLTVNLEERTTRRFFQKKYLLRDIHMYIQPGHMVLLLGGSGAGKTTFVNAVNGYEKADAEIVLNGRNVYKNYREMQYDVGFVPQADLMRGTDTVERTLTDSAALRLPADFSRAARKERVEQVMKTLGLTEVRHSQVSALSGGQRKRLSIAMELISSPSLFILDEPDSGLDGVMARELFERLREVADQGKIALVITHTPDRVIDLFDDVIVLAKDGSQTGRLAFYGSVPEARAFFGKEKMEEIVRCVNSTEEGGDGLADEFILRYAEVQHG